MTTTPVSATRCPRAGVPIPGRRPAAGSGTTAARTFAVRTTRHPACSRPASGLIPSSARGRYRPAPARGPGLGTRAGCAPGGLTGRPEWELDACGPGRQASPPRRPASGTATPSHGGAAPPVTARDPPPRPAGVPRRAGGTVRQPAPGRTGHPRSLLPFPRGPAPASAAAGRAGAGLDAAGGAERPSWQAHGRAAAGNAHRSRPALHHPGRRTRNPGRPAADDRGGDRRAADLPGRVLPLAPAGHRAAGGTAARRRGAGPT